MESPVAVLFVGSPPTGDSVRRHLATDDRVDVVTVAGPEAGLDALGADAFDCVVCEHDLPDGDAVDFLATVGERAPETVRLLFASNLSEADAAAALDAGVTDVVQKAGDVGYDLLAAHVVAAVRSRADATDDEADGIDRIDRIASVVRDINRALVWSRSREELEERVCEILSESDPYRFAWIGGVDPTTDRIEPRAGAGREDGYLDDIVVTADDSATGRGPGGQAVRTGDIAVVQHIATAPSFEPWREAAQERGFDSVAAVPLTYEDYDYGVLVVYADEPAAFDAAERDLLSEVASDIAYATNALALRREVDQLTDFVEHAPIGVFNTDPASDGVMLDANPAMAEIFDADGVEDVVGRPVVDFYADADERETVLDALEREGVVTREIQLKTVSGRGIWGNLTLVRNEQPDGSFVIAGAVKDITARKRLEQRLGEELTFIESILETSPVAITVLDADGTIVRANEYAEDVLGLTESELVDRTYDAPEWRIFGADDDPIAGEDLPFARVVRTGEPVYDYEHGIEHPDGERVWLSINMVPITDTNGDVVQAVAAMSDVSELKAQEEALDERQQQIAFFNNLLRHEVLNGMTVIEGASDLLLDSLSPDDELYPVAERIRSRSDDIVTTVQRVRKVLRQLTVEEPDLDARDLSAVVADRVAQLESDYPAATVAVDVPDEAPVVADGLLRDVVYNLLANAAQHNDSPDPHVDVSITVAGDTTTLRVADDGPGIPDDIKEEVFGRGDWTPTSPSGFGLYFVDTMVSRYGGAVWAEDNDPRGTVFVVEFPTGNGT